MSILNLNTMTNFADGINSPMYALEVCRGDLVEVMTEDGPSGDFACTIILIDTMTFDSWELPYTFIGSLVTTEEEDGDWTTYVNSASKAEKMIEKIKARGTVDLSKWVKQ